MDSEVESSRVSIKDIILNDTPFEPLEEQGDPMAPLRIDIEDYLHVVEGKWEIIGYHLDKDPIYDADDEPDKDLDLPCIPCH